MAKSDESSWLTWLVLGGLVYLFLTRQTVQDPAAAAMPGVATIGPAVTQPIPSSQSIPPANPMNPLGPQPPDVINPAGTTVTIAVGGQLPPAPAGYQWYAPPTGAQLQEVTYTLEPAGTSHPRIDPRMIM